MQTFRSTAHPDGKSLGYVYAQALVSPLAACMLPVMIVTLVAVLEGARVLPSFIAASGLAVLLAIGWTHFQLRRTPAVLHVTDGYAAVQTVWNVLRGHRELNWGAVLDVREQSSGVLATIGYQSFTLERANWADHHELEETLVTARHRPLQQTEHEQNEH